MTMKIIDKILADEIVTRYLKGERVESITRDLRTKGIILSSGSIYTLFKKMNVPTYQQGGKRRIQVPDLEGLLDRFLKEGATISELSKEVGVSAQVLKARFAEMGGIQR